MDRLLGALKEGHIRCIVSPLSKPRSHHPSGKSFDQSSSHTSSHASKSSSDHTAESSAVRSSLRSLLHLHGPHSYKFLQSMCTKKIVSYEESFEHGDFCDYAGFLTNKGRLLSDSLLYHRRSSHSFFIETPSSAQPQIIQHLNQYKMRNQIYIDSEDIQKSYQLFSMICTSEQNRKELVLWLLNQTAKIDLHFYQDPRWEMAFRIIAPFDVNRTYKETSFVCDEQGDCDQAPHNQETNEDVIGFDEYTDDDN